jgi:hypothetical protein
MTDLSSNRQCSLTCAPAQMALAFDPGQPPAHLFRHTLGCWSRRSFQRLCPTLLAATGTGVVVATSAHAGSWRHRARVLRTQLRGSFMNQPVAAHPVKSAAAGSRLPS